MERTVIVITGPTCSGKTKASIELAQKRNGEIISADSRQIYRHLNIGTAKPDTAELNSAPHHFIDMLNPDEEYNASRFETDSLEVCRRLFQQGKVPVVCGGSGLYVRALVDGIFNSVDTDEEIRKDLLEKRKTNGDQFLYDELKKVDPESASKILPQNWKRVIRALEVFMQTGRPIGELQKGYKREDDFNFMQFGLLWNREVLYKRIEERVDRMIETGLVDETEKILSIGYSKELNSLNTVGYKEIIAFLNGEFTLERAVELIKRNTRRFAKRQMTWFRGDERIKWLEVESESDIQGAVQSILQLY